MKRRQDVALALLVLVGAGACSSTEDAGEPPAPRCPSVAIVEGAHRIAMPPPAVTEDPSRLLYIAALSDLRSTCRYTGNAVEVDVGFNLLAERGPALEADGVDLSYFVATVGPDQSILSKEIFGTELEFAEGQPITGVVETMTLHMPLSSPAEGAARRLYVGFQLEDDELRAPSPLPPE